jgi:hypothetical protein
MINDINKINDINSILEKKIILQDSLIELLEISLQLKKLSNKVDNRIAILEDRMKDCDRSIKND